MEIGGGMKGLLAPHSVNDNTRALQSAVRTALQNYNDAAAAAGELGDPRFIGIAAVGELLAKDVAQICVELGPLADLVDVAEGYLKATRNTLNRFRKEFESDEPEEPSEPKAA